MIDFEQWYEEEIGSENKPEYEAAKWAWDFQQAKIDELNEVVNGWKDEYRIMSLRYERSKKRINELQKKLDCCREENKALLDKLNVPGGCKLVPVEPSEEMWGGLARHLVKYMQSHDRYCPKTLGKYISRFIGFKNIPDWLDKEVPDWESDHAFSTADLGVFIYKAMIGAAP